MATRPPLTRPHVWHGWPSLTELNTLIAHAQKNEQTLDCVIVSETWLSENNEAEQSVTFSHVQHVQTVKQDIDDVNANKTWLPESSAKQRTTAAHTQHEKQAFNQINDSKTQFSENKTTNCQSNAAPFRLSENSKIEQSAIISNYQTSKQALDDINVSESRLPENSKIKQSATVSHTQIVKQDINDIDADKTWLPENRKTNREVNAATRRLPETSDKQNTLDACPQTTKQTLDCVNTNQSRLPENKATTTLLAALRQARPFWQHQAVFCLPPIVPHLRLFLIAPDAFPAWAATQPTLFQATCAPERLAENTIDLSNKTDKPWWRYPPTSPVTRVAIIGAGIAGAATAYALAQRGVAVDVFDQNDIAQAASGNRQGLLYAKIAAHNTAQTELLLAGYGFSRLLLAHTLAESHGWQACGVLHLNDNPTESKRNRQLAAQSSQNTLYQSVNKQQAGTLAGIDLDHDGLWWPYGAAIHPPAWVAALLRHPLIHVHTHHPITALHHNGSEWQLTSATTTHTASHVVICAGAQSNQLAPLNGWPLSLIRGQTTVATVQPHTLAAQLRCALSGTSYLSPAWQGQLCFGATFLPNNHNTALTAADQTHNWQALAQLTPALATELRAQQPTSPNLNGHAALRCDAFDHLPLVGPVGQAEAMRTLYAKLTHDKHYRLHQPCPYWPNLYLNTAHGSRGLATAPISGEAIAATILGLANPLSARLQQALHPNRLVIRSLTHHVPWGD